MLCHCLKFVKGKGQQFLIVSIYYITIQNFRLCCLLSKISRAWIISQRCHHHQYCSTFRVIFKITKIYTCSIFKLLKSIEKWMKKESYISIIFLCSLLLFKSWLFFSSLSISTSSASAAARGEMKMSISEYQG